MKKLICGMCFVLLLAGNVFAGQAKAVEVDVLAKTGHSWDGSRLPRYPKGIPEITILRITIPPGSVLPVHKHPVINAGVLLSGKLTVVTEDNKTLHLKAGDSIVEVVNKWHYGKNEGDKPAEIIVFYAGVQGRPITIRKEPVPDKASPRMKTMHRKSARDMSSHALPDSFRKDSPLDSCTAPRIL